MPIAKSTIRDFLDRQLNSYEWIKDLKRSKLEAWLAEERIPVEFITKPFLFQLCCIAIGLEVPRFLFFLEPGMGKTKVVLDIIAHRIKRGEVHRVLVFVPSLAAIESWREQVETHQPSLTYQGFLGSSDQKYEDLINSSAQICVVNYQGMLALVTSREKDKKTGKIKWRVDTKFMQRLAGVFDAIICDEIHRIANRATQTYRMVRWASKHMDVRYGLTGTPFGRDPVMLWGEFNAIDDGETLGEHVGIFKEAFFSKQDDYWGTYKHVFLQRMSPLLHEFMHNRSIAFEAEECLDLPPKTWIPKVCTLPTSTVRAYNELAEQMLIRSAGGMQLKLTFMKLRQVASGFLNYKGEDDNTHVLEFRENPKLDLLEDLVAELPDKRKLVIFHQFKWSGARIGRMLEESFRMKEGKDFGRLWSGTKDQAKVYRKFREDPKNRVLVVALDLGADVLNLQVASHMAFFELPVSPIKYQQALKRIDRPGQDAAKLFYFLLLAKGTVDEKILDYLKEGQDMLNMVLRGRLTRKDLLIK